MVGDGEGIAIAPIAQLELALEIRAPEIVGRSALGERRAGSAVARRRERLDQPMTAQDRVHRALGGNAKVAIEPAHQKLADFAGAPMRLVSLERDDQSLDLRRELIGVADRPPRTVAQRLKALLLVPVEYLVAGLARNPELATDLAHRLAIQKPGDEPQTLIHDRTLLPGHRHLPPGMPGGRCHPCVRYKLSPMSRAAQIIGQGGRATAERPSRRSAPYLRASPRCAGPRSISPCVRIARTSRL